MMRPASVSVPEVSTLASVVLTEALVIVVVSYHEVPAPPPRWPAPVALPPALPPLPPSGPMVPSPPFMPARVGVRHLYLPACSKLFWMAAHPALPPAPTLSGSADPPAMPPPPPAMTSGVPVEPFWMPTNVAPPPEPPLRSDSLAVLDGPPVMPS